MTKQPKGSKRIAVFSAISVFLLAAVAAVLLIGGSDLPGFDVYFHLAVANDYANGIGYQSHLTEGALAAFSADREPLFHWLLALPLLVGIKPEIAAVLVTALGCGLFASALYFYSQSFLVAIVGTLGSVTFLQRMLFCRPHVIAVGLVAWGLVFLLKNRYWLAAAVNLVYTLAYSVPVVLLGCAFIQAIFRRQAKGLVLVGAASLLGLIVNPGFPDNLSVLWYQGPCVLANALAGNPYETQLPRELNPWEISSALGDLWFFIAVMAIGAYRRTTPLWLVVLQVAALALALRSTRFVEIFVPLAAVSAGPVITWAFQAKGIHVGWRMAGKAILFVATVVVAVTSISLMSPPTDVMRYNAAAKWLRTNAEGSYVYNAEWSSYAVLRYHGGNFGIAQGHDPVFLAAYDPEKYRLTMAAWEGKVPLETFLARFPADFIVAAQRSRLARRYGMHPATRVRLQSSGVVVLQVDREKARPQA